MFKYIDCEKIKIISSSGVHKKMYHSGRYLLSFEKRKFEICFE